MDILIGGWLALQLTDSAWHVALIGFYRNVPVLAFGAFAGAIADRVDRRVLVILAEATNVAVSGTVAVLLLTGRLEYWHLAVANVVLGLAWSVEWPSRRAMIPDLAGRDRLLPAIGLDTQSMNANKVLGPIVGGALLATLGITNCFVLLTAVYALGLLPLFALKLPRDESPVRSTSTLRFIYEGLKFCHKSQPVRGVLLITIVMNSFAFPYMQLLSVFAQDVLQVGPASLGLLAAGDGIGSLIGTALLMNLRLRRQGWVFVLGSVGMCILLVLFALSPVYGLSLVALIAAGVLHSGFSMFQSTIILGAVADALRGRAMGVLTLAIGSAPVGMLLMGAVAAVLGAPLAVAASATLGGGLIAAVAATTPGLLAHAAAEGGAPAASGRLPEPLPDRSAPPARTPGEPLSSS